MAKETFLFIPILKKLQRASHFACFVFQLYHSETYFIVSLMIKYSTFDGMFRYDMVEVENDLYILYPKFLLSRGTIGEGFSNPVSCVLDRVRMINWICMLVTITMI